MNREIFLKYLHNKCSDQEFEELARWVKQNVQLKEGRNWSFDQWKSFDPELQEKDEKKYGALLDKIHHEINLKHREKEEREFIPLSNIAQWLCKVAAILFIPLLGVVFYLLKNNNIQADKYADLTVDSLEVISPVGSRTVLQLSDGTEVNLNYGSKMKYPRNFTGNTREITLVGEGYFDVAHHPDKPFIVKTQKLNVKALGTKFNVQAYPEDDVVSTTLVEGKVLIDKILPGEKIEQIGVMVPGQHLAYHWNTDEIVSSQGNTKKYISWKEGLMIFDNTPIADVARELSRKFNVDIEVEDNLKDLTYTVTFMDDPLNLILDLMTQTTPVTYQQFPREKLADGTFSKQKIRIGKRKWYYNLTEKTRKCANTSLQA